MLRSKFVKFLLSILKRQADSSPNFVSLFNFIKDNSSVLFLAWATYTLLKRSPLKWKLVKLLGAQIKICQIPSVNFGTKSIPLRILHPSSVSWKAILMCIFSSNNIYFAQKKPIKVKEFETFKWSGQNLSNSLCQFWNDKLFPLQSLYHPSVSWKIIPLYFFSLSNRYFAEKKPINVKISETFE